jgi:transposase
MAAALAYRWDGRRARLYFHPPRHLQRREPNRVRPRVRRHFAGQQVILLWDGLPSHRSRRMREFLAKQGRWLEVERLPAYAPELNPAEGLWANLKGQELANRCEDAIEVVGLVARVGARRIRGDQDLLFGFLRHVRLTFEEGTRSHERPEPCRARAAIAHSPMSSV